MQFYKVYVELNSGKSGDDDTTSKFETAHRISTKTSEFNDADLTRCCFIHELKSTVAGLGLITSTPTDVSALAEAYATIMELDVKNILVEEVTITAIQNLIRSADCLNYIEEDVILARYSLDKIGRRRGIEFGESLVNHRADKKSLFDSAKKHFMQDTLIPELERIYAGAKSKHAKGHPVHYIVETDDRDTRRDVYKILLDALYANKRLDNSRYTFLDFQPGESYSKMAYDLLYKLSDGGAVVVRYLGGDSTNETDEASDEMDVIKNICEMATRYRNSVLTVFCFPRECKNTKAQFYEHLGTMALVEIREDLVSGEDARTFLDALAKSNHIRTDKSLFSSIKPECSYLATELKAEFNEWYNIKLKSTVYPQYKDVAVARKEVIKAKPQGSAFEELNAMIGLGDAKDVIKKAINYYKIQQLYEEKGVKRDNPAMHMIFTGNPGTAKTTVARLFARIMKDNKLLSKGQLVEVGRGDLVGKFVGWTAQTVQDKFKAASGGVLFIDEAYSLVDDRNGSYGDEAINTIVQEMENHRADVVVIFAGYPDKMEGFLQKNPGLRSRIAFHVPFADYSSKELCDIAELIGKKNGMGFTTKALDKLEKAFDVARRNPDFGNGRYVRNVFEQSKMNQATRLVNMDLDEISADEITTLTEDDIVIPEDKKASIGRIGFC